MRYNPLSVEELAKKLRPVFGEKIDNLFLKYKLSDTKEKKFEIEQAFNALYNKYLSSNLLSDKIFLEPPKNDLIKGEYPLATVTYADKELYPFCLREKDWPRHMLITGMSGSGKTTFAYQILGNFIKKNKPFVVFDWKKSFRPLLLLNKKMLCFTVGNENIANIFRVNINKPPKGVSPKEWINTLVDLITESFNASFGVHKVLVEVLDNAFKSFGVYQGSENYPTWLQIKDRLEWLMHQSTSHGRESEWITSALRVAHALTFGAFGEAICYKGPEVIDIEDLFDNKQTIFELNSLNTAEKKFFCEFMLTYIYKLKKSNDREMTSEFKNAILVDEAHNIFLKDRPNFVKESVTDQIYRELREYGTSLICLDQHASKLSETVIGNSACNVAFQQILPADVDCISSLMQLYEHKKYFTMLEVGHAIVMLAERYHSPFIVKAPFIEFKQKTVSNEYIAKTMKETLNFDKKLEMFKDTCKTEELVKKIYKVDSAAKSTGVDVRPIDGNEMIKKRRVNLTNHVQKNLIDAIQKHLELGYTMSHTKKLLCEQKFKLTDINKAMKFIAESKDRELAQKAYKGDADAVSEDEARFIGYVKQNKDCNITKIYAALGLSARRGNDIKNDMLKKDLVTVEDIKTDIGWKKRVFLTEKAKVTV